MGSHTSRNERRTPFSLQALRWQILRRSGSTQQSMFTQDFAWHWHGVLYSYIGVLAFLLTVSFFVARCETIEKRITPKRDRNNVLYLSAMLSNVGSARAVSFAHTRGALPSFSVDCCQSEGGREHRQRRQSRRRRRVARRRRGQQATMHVIPNPSDPHARNRPRQRTRRTTALWRRKEHHKRRKSAWKKFASVPPFLWHKCRRQCVSRRQRQRQRRQRPRRRRKQS